MNEVQRPVQNVLLGSGAAVVVLVLLTNLWPLVGRSVEDRSRSLLLGIAVTFLALALLLVPLALLALAVYGAVSVLTRRS